MPEEPKKIMVTVKTEDGEVERALDPLQIEHLKDTYYETALYLSDGSVWKVKESVKELSNRIQKLNL